MIKFTSKVRRGLRQFIDRDLRGHVEQIVTNGTRLGLARGQRLTVGEIEELRAAVAWIEQEATVIAKPEEPAMSEVQESAP